jgi:hypothetical protein
MNRLRRRLIEAGPDVNVAVRYSRNEVILTCDTRTKAREPSIADVSTLLYLRIEADELPIALLKPEDSSIKFGWPGRLPIGEAWLRRIDVGPSPTVMRPYKKQLG